jgi:plastocyanin
MKNYIFTLCLFFCSSFFVFAQFDDVCEGADVVIATEGLSFNPDAIEVPVGTTVGWVNTMGTHNANGDVDTMTGESFGNPEPFYFELVTGNSEGVCIGTFEFTTPGTYNYDCTGYGHAAAGMVATLIVSDVKTGIPGCTDYLACNFDLTATEDDNSCEFAEWGYDCDGNCIIDLDEDGICDTCLEYDMIVVDCECDFFDPATYTVFFINIDEENCVFTEDCYCECYNDEDGDGICDENEEGTIVDELEALSVLIYPNPASNNLTVDLSDLNGVNTTMKLYDSSSKLVFEKQSSTTLIIDITGYAKGLYTLELSISDKVLRSQVVIE